MFTLQILDRGQTSLHPVAESAMVLGSGAEADIRLGEVGVLSTHVRFEPTPEGVRLIAEGPVTVNGRGVRSAQLALGDRIEIGRAVVVLGRSVSRAAKPEDVLAETVSRTRTVRSKTQRGRAWLPIAVAVGMLAAILAFVLWNGDASDVHNELARVARLRQSGQLGDAQAAIDKLQSAWVGAADDRLQRLAGEQQALAEIGVTTERLLAEVLDPEVSRTYAEWSRELQRLEGEGSASEQVAARRVRASLRETMGRRPTRPVKTAPGASALATLPAPAKSEPPESRQSESAAPRAPSGQRSPAMAPAMPNGAPISSTSSPGASPGATTSETIGDRSTVAVAFAEASRLAEQGLFTQALALLEAELGKADGPTTLAQVQQRVDEVRGKAQQAMRTVLDEASRVVAGGKPAEAVELLAAAHHRFPTTPEFATLSTELSRIEQLVATSAPRSGSAARPDAVDESVRVATLASLRAHLDRVRDAEERAAFAEAAQLLREGADLVKAKDADFANRLAARAAEAELLAAWHANIAAVLQTGRVLTAATAAGQDVQLRGVDRAALLGTSVDGEKRLTWHEISSAGLLALVEQSQPTGDALLGVATLLYKQGEPERAEALLVKALRSDAKQKPRIDGVLARGRGEPLDGQGYILGKDGFVSARSIEVQKQAQKLAARLEAALRDKRPGARDALVTDVLAAGPDSLAVLVAALQTEFARQVQKLESGSLKKQVDRLAQQRLMLDEARHHALELIYDEVKYFYPYKPPAVSSKRFAEYAEVQAEVDRRVAALRTVWRDDRLQVRVPASLRSDLDRLDWVAKVLGDLGELDQATLGRVAWARALPIGDSVGIQDYCSSSAERVEIEAWRRIEAYNTIVGKQLTSAAREQLRATNDYRAMFRHRPLAIVRMVCDAAQGHAEEMSRLGYFDHMSPTPGHRTPFDRMQLAGYKFGVSENIALADNAVNAHNAWCQSSGHHRNLLNPGHQEVGIGADGRYWVQNFGSGDAHCSDPAWAAAHDVGHR